MAEEKQLIVKKNKKHHVDIALAIVTLVLLSLGVIMVLSASAPSAFRTEGDSYYYFKKQLLYAAIGIVVMFVTSKIDYKIYSSKVISYGLFAVALVLLIVVLIPGIGIKVNDARRWIKIGIQFQPSEIMKVALIILMSSLISRNPDRLKKFLTGLLPYLLLVVLVGFLLMMEPHMSATIIIVFIAGAILLVGGVNIKHLLPFIPIAAVAGYILSVTSEYRWKRVTIFIDPWQDPLGNGWQIIQSLYAICSGGLFGVGLGQSTQKYMYIPEPHNDFIFAIWAEEMGLFGVLLIMVLFAIFIWRGVMISIKAPDLFGSLLAIGITVMIGIQAVFSIAVVSSSMPVTGIPLPFFSYGGTALIILMFCVGILLNISRKAKI